MPGASDWRPSFVDWRRWVHRAVDSPRVQHAHGAHRQRARRRDVLAAVHEPRRTAQRRASAARCGDGVGVLAERCRRDASQASRRSHGSCWQAFCLARRFTPIPPRALCRSLTCCLPSLIRSSLFALHSYPLPVHARRSTACLHSLSRPVSSFFRCISILAQAPEADVRLQQLVTIGAVSALQKGDAGPLLANIRDTLGMFTFRGDPVWRYNIAGRPVFDPLVGALFYLGLLVALWRVRRAALPVRVDLAAGGTFARASFRILRRRSCAPAPRCRWRFSFQRSARTG